MSITLSPDDEAAIVKMIRPMNNVQLVDFIFGVVVLDEESTLPSRASNKLKACIIEAKRLTGALVSALVGHTDPRVRSVAISYLQAVQTEAGVIMSCWATLLGDEDQPVREDAAVTLHNRAHVIRASNGGKVPVWLDQLTRSPEFFEARVSRVTRGFIQQNGHQPTVESLQHSIPTLPDDYELPAA